jgi:ferric-dicitrate binding protein FerR (iron transport regulator)
MVKRRKLLRLIRKYLEGKASNKEKKFIEKYYRYFGFKDSPSDSLSEVEKREMESKMLRNIHAEMQQAVDKPTGWNYKKINVRLATAAMFAIFIAGIAFLYTYKEKMAKVAPQTQVADIAPGGNRAVLTLSNGSTIALTHLKNGLLVNQGNTEVIKSDSGQITYRAAQTRRKKVAKAYDEIHYNTLSTPPSGNYQVVLPDGSKVWLNASSSLRFPTAFRGKERKVEVRGEAYFEVKKDNAHPFVVQIYTPDGEGMGTVKVLGTYFNINAYMDHPSVKTTLVEGAIKITKGASQELLKAGEQATIKQKKDQIEVTKINSREAIAWKNGFFQFEGTDIVTIMHEIARWYNVEVSYNSQPHGRYSGIISRHTRLSQVLQILEAGGFRFKVTGRKIVVNP